VVGGAEAYLSHHARFIDHRTTDFTRAVRDVDVAFDLVAGEVGARTVGVLGPGGLLVTIDRTNAGLAALARDTGRRVQGIAVEPDRLGLEGLAALVDTGKLRVHVSAVLPIEEAALGPVARRRQLLPERRGDHAEGQALRHSLTLEQRRKILAEAAEQRYVQREVHELLPQRSAP
jgi:hypothetical protein